MHFEGAGCNWSAVQQMAASGGGGQAVTVPCQQLPAVHAKGHISEALCHPMLPLLLYSTCAALVSAVLNVQGGVQKVAVTAPRQPPPGFYAKLSTPALPLW
jgi:hypothetical protein